MSLERWLSLLMLFSYLVGICANEFLQGGMEALQGALPIGLTMLLPVIIIWNADAISDRPLYNAIRPEAAAVVVRFTAWLFAIYLVGMYIYLSGLD